MYDLWTHNAYFATSRKSQYQRVEKIVLTFVLYLFWYSDKGLGSLNNIF